MSESRQVTVFLLLNGELTRREAVFAAGNPWVAVGQTSECEIQVPESDFPQLGFQINWPADRAPTLYVHPARVLADGQVLEATVKHPFFPLAGPVAIRLNGTATLFLVLGDGELPDAEARLKLDEARAAFDGAAPGAYVFRLGCLPNTPETPPPVRDAVECESET